MNAIIIVLTVGIVVGISVFAGKLFPIILPRLNKMFDRKPFNCRPCFTFHLVWLGVGFLSVLFHNIELFVIGVALAFIIFFVVKYFDNQKIIE